jgi:DNA-binding transcriptional MerR regulator
VLAASAPTEKSVAALQDRVDALAAELEDATRLFDERRETLDRTLQADYAAATAAEQAQGRLAAAQAAFGDFVSDAYRNPRTPSAFLLLRDGPAAYVDRRLVEKALGRSTEDRKDALAALDRARLTSEKGAATRQALTAKAIAEQRDVDVALADIQARVAAGQAELEAAAQALAVEQARQAAELAAQQAAAAQAASLQRSSVPTGGGATCLADPVGLVANGFLPESSLCFLRTAPGHRLRPSAAQRFDAMSDAYAAAFGAPICVTDSYRSYAEQVDVFARKPNLAATPGRSNHGLGLAVDLCGGIQAFGSAAHLWMQQNAPTYGWVHPGWARQGGSKPEAWHWEYQGPGSGKGTPVRVSG